MGRKEVSPVIKHNIYSSVTDNIVWQSRKWCATARLIYPTLCKKEHGIPNVNMLHKNIWFNDFLEAYLKVQKLCFLNLSFSTNVSTTFVTQFLILFQKTMHWIREALKSHWTLNFFDLLSIKLPFQLLKQKEFLLLQMNISIINLQP